MVQIAENESSEVVHAETSEIETAVHVHIEEIDVEPSDSLLTMRC